MEQSRDEEEKKFLYESRTLVDSVIAASLGGLFTTVACCPLDVVKTRLQSQSSSLISNSVYLRGTMDAFSQIVHREGIATLWRGLGPAILVSLPSITIYLTTYDRLKKKLDPSVAGACARIMSAVVASPMEILRTYQQSSSSPTGSVRVFQNLIKDGGITKAWTGLTPTLLRDVPFSAIYWSLYESIKRKNIFNITDNFSANFVAGALAGSMAAVVTNPCDVVKTQMQIVVDNVNVVDKRKMKDVVYKLYVEEGWKAFWKGGLTRMMRISFACAVLISSYQFIQERIVQRRPKLFQ